jgi:two-component system nitrogen regulation response regulator GlnG
MATLLLIDDEPVIQHAFRKAFHPPDYTTLTVRTAAEGLERLRTAKPDVVVLDVHLPDADRLEAFDRIKQADARVPVILITGHGTTDLAIEAMKRGAFDYLLKPLQYEKLRDVIGRACATSRLMTTPAVVAEREPVPDRADVLVGRCEAMQDVYKAIGQVAGTDVTVLLTGESGTGKELVARAIYQHSRRADHPFIALNCGAIPETLIESELFGHEKGAFTGADRRRIGRFEQCAGGTLFLDEVGEMPPLAQVKLLRVLQEQRFERVGGSETIQSDVRVIAATNADLEKEVAAGRFRRDLYFRLKVFAIHLPPLRERGDDIDLLSDFYLARFGREIDRPPPIVPPETRAALRAYPWPGNARELQSVLKQAFLRMTGAILTPDFLALNTATEASPKSPVALQRLDASRSPEASRLDWDGFISDRLAAGTKDLYSECLEIMERQLLTRLLTQTGGNQLRAAEILGITRGSLRHKLRSLGIPAGRMTDSDLDID